MSNIPLVNWPDNEGRYKVLQFYGPDNAPLLRFSHDVSSGNHSTILLGFADEFGVVTTYDDEGIPKLPDDSPYVLCGAGFCNLFPEGRMAIFNGCSSTYDRGISPKHVKDLASRVTGWRLF
ncbi:hypothetical protein COU61_02060 [Candidatus Pacearchaeota archaeon CG10_big_fil_rev_8_21_14_0_10_35_13]|nr:MAG: hypothetical protein COU61_02060 [Candidatus Pacearchaeota archaeon CG10_big_fil_rev_8_21_14_0_10_35_13]